MLHANVLMVVYRHVPIIGRPEALVLASAVRDMYSVCRVDISVTLIERLVFPQSNSTHQSTCLQLVEWHRRLISHVCSLACVCC